MKPNNPHVTNHSSEQSTTAGWWVNGTLDPGKVKEPQSKVNILFKCVKNVVKVLCNMGWASEVADHLWNEDKYGFTL